MENIIRYRTLNHIEYSKSYFNQAPKLIDLLIEVATEINKCIYTKGVEDDKMTYNIQKNDMEKIIKYLKKGKDNFTDEIIKILESLEKCNYQLTDIICFLEEAFEKADTENNYIQFDMSL